MTLLCTPRNLQPLQILLVLLLAHIVFIHYLVCICQIEGFRHALSYLLLDANVPFSSTIQSILSTPVPTSLVQKPIETQHIESDLDSRKAQLNQRFQIIICKIWSCCSVTCSVHECMSSSSKTHRDAAHRIRPRLNERKLSLHRPLHNTPLLYVQTC